VKEAGKRAAEHAVLACLRKQFVKHSSQGRVILAVSGGVDSMALLEAASRVAPDLARVLVAHVNHNLRGEASRGDAAFVRERALAHGLAFTEICLEWNGEVASQSSCRKRRDAFFLSLLSHPSDRVWLAHHLNDQAETVFFRLLRGSGARGLRGMLPESGFKVRPFLALEKRTLVAAVDSFGGAWREDASNQDREAYERNWLRGFFPVLEERRPRFQQKLAALALEAQGWELPRARFDTFEVAGGISLYRLSGAVPATRALAEEFKLGRMHAMRLSDLLQKGSGEWHAEGVRFTWSAGVLLCERAATRLQVFVSLSEGAAEGSLGAWKLPQGAQFLELKTGAGETRKKEFQALCVPRFFRGGVPLVEWKGRTRALLPARFPALAFEPSALGAWWLGQKRD
jgi:tRNA(Ile)-lysidine synthetase-like protein